MGPQRCPEARHILAAGALGLGLWGCPVGLAGVRQETCCKNWCFHTSDAQCTRSLPAVLRESSPGSGRSSAKTTVTGGRAMSPRCSSRNVVLGIPVLMVSVLRGFPTASLSGWASRAQPHGGKRRTNLGFFITAATRRCQPAALDVLKVRLVDLITCLVAVQLTW